MYVKLGGSNGVALYVPNAMRQLGSNVSIVLNGTAEIGGNFYQDATTNVFNVGTDTKTISTGNFRFGGNLTGMKYITTQSVDLNTFDRGAHYVAFPNVQMATNDSIVVPGRMGMDATTLKRYGTYTDGQMILRSEVVGSNAYDASLRITGAGSTSSNLVTPGAVIVERDMTLYRPTGSGTTQLFGFATPFDNTQLSGYFAGNWVRRPVADATGHTTYIYGNKDISPADGIIDMDQYVYLAAEKLVPAQAYLIKPRPQGYSYSNLQTTNGLWYTADDASAYDKGKFYFNGKVYTTSAYDEQLFAKDELYSKSITSAGSTINLLVGNSYTAPISTNLLGKAMENSSLTFSPYIYVYPAGSATYVPKQITGSGDAIVVADITEIPAMSVFMIRVSKTQSGAGTGTFTLGKELLRHGDVSHNNPAAVKSAMGAPALPADKVINQVVFSISPSTNTNIYDLSAIGLRSDAVRGSDNYDMQKAYVNDEQLFQLYTTSETGTKLAANGLPLETDTISMLFKPSTETQQYTLTSKYDETLQTEGLWLFDKQLGKWNDLKINQRYTFSAAKNDNPNRFLISFKIPKELTDDSSGTSNKLDMFYAAGKLHINQLTELDLNATVTIFDPSGRLVYSSKVETYPAMTINANQFTSGVYIVQMRGKHSGIGKFVIKN
ncbi:MAG: T9SS type A sorting domain-containing protein [Paludibacteraceae bacterium]